MPEAMPQASLACHSSPSRLAGDGGQLGTHDPSETEPGDCRASRFAAVWQIRCIAVNQNSAVAGQEITFAVISFAA